MPLQRFKPTSGSCKLCSGEIECAVGGPHSEPKECPRCGQAIERLPPLSAAPAKVLRKPSTSEAKGAGFQVLKRVGKGEYEKL